MTGSAVRAEALAPEALRAQREFSFSDKDYRRIAALIQVDAGIDLGSAKAALVYSRLAKRLRALGLHDFESYCDLVEAPEGETERTEMLSALTTNVTRFFRERGHFDHLERHVLPALTAQARKGGRVRIWSAGCSTGEEAYSLALSVLAVDPDAHQLDIRILATDIDRSVVATARAGVYPSQSLAEVPAPLRNRYFRRAEGGETSYRIAAEARALVGFRRLNLHGDWPMRGQFQIIFCRNVVIYFDAQAQQALWRRFVEQLAPQGWLYIGHSERVAGPAAARLRPAGATTYQRREDDPR
jgi:chemotaxis protein methyltransferase CheR